MIQRNILEICGFLFLFFLLYIGYPALCFGRILKERTAYDRWDRSLIYVTASTFFYTMLGYLLAAFKILNTPVLLVTLLLVWLACAIAQLGRKGLLPYCKRKFSRLSRYITGTASFRLYTEQRLRNTGHRFWSWLVSNVLCHPVRSLAILAFLVGFFYTRFYPMIVADWYGQPDMYVHLSWISGIMEGTVFPSDIYPEAMHINIIVLAKVFGVSVISAVKYWGAINCAAFLLALYCLLRRCYRSQTVILTAFWFIFCSGMVFSDSIKRISYSLPQECGYVFALVAACFLIDYFRDKKTLQLIGLGVGFALTIMFHFYSAIFAVLLLLAIAVFHLRTCFSKKHFWRFLVTAVAALAAACLPFGVAAACGEDWNGSIDWAISMMEGSSQGDSEKDNELIPAESGALAPEEEEEEEEEDSYDPKLDRDRLYFASRFIYVYDCFTVDWAFPLCAALFLLSVVFLIVRAACRRWDTACSATAGLLLFAFVLWGMMTLDVFEAISLMPIVRIRFLFIIALMSSILLPLDMLVSARSSIPRKVLSYAVQAGVIGLAAWMMFDLHMFMDLGFYQQTEYNPAVLMINNLTTKKTPGTYTVVTTTDSLYRIKGHGYHYETWSFLDKMENYVPGSEVHIPTPYVYFVVEKKTLKPDLAHHFGDVRYQPLEITDEMVQDTTLFADRSEYKDEPYDYFYLDDEHRVILDAKFHAWAEQFSRFFPKEMVVLYEDDEVMLYRFRQEVNTAANFAIPYWDEAMMEELL